MTKWEYKYEKFDNLDAPVMIKIKKLGKDGWELVGFTTVDSVYNGTSDNVYKLIFKRPVK